MLSVALVGNSSELLNRDPFVRRESLMVTSFAAEISLQQTALM